MNFIEVTFHSLKDGLEGMEPRGREARRVNGGNPEENGRACRTSLGIGTGEILRHSRLFVGRDKIRVPKLSHVCGAELTFLCGSTSLAPFSLYWVCLIVPKGLADWEARRV